MATIASGYYPHNSELNHPWNAASAELVRSTLSVYRPVLTDTLEATEKVPLSREAILRFAQDFVRRAKVAGARTVILYYVGHGYPSQAGEILLGQGAGPIDSDTGEPQALELSALYAALESRGIPFALLVDQCFEDKNVQTLAQSKGFILNPMTGDLDYLGDAEVIGGELSELSDALRAYGSHLAYIRSANPIVFAAKPGTLARARSNPDWTLGALVGPLAWRMNFLARGIQTGLAAPTLGEFIRMVPDSRGGTGEVSFRGSISWSDFDLFLHQTRALTLEGGTSARMEGAAPRISLLPGPEFGTVNDFTRTLEATVVIAGWNVLRWPRNGDSATSLQTDVSAGSVRSDAQGAWFHLSTRELFFAHDSGPPRLIREQIYVGFIGAGANHKTAIAVEQNGDVSSSDAVWRLSSTGVVEIDRFETDHLFDLVEWEDGVFYFTEPDSGSLMRRSGGQIQRISSALRSPGSIDFTSTNLYVLSQTRQHLYRVAKDGQVSMLYLGRYDEGSMLPHEWSVRGFSALDDDHFLIAGKKGIVAVDSTGANWSPVE